MQPFNQLSERDARLLRLSAALLVEQLIRKKRTLEDIALAIVNDSVRVHGQEKAVFLIKNGRRFRMKAITNVGRPDPSAPLVHWIERCVTKLARGLAAGPEIRVISKDQLDILPNEEWVSWTSSAWLWMPLTDYRGQIFGVLILLRSQLWRESDRLLAEPMAGCYGHAFSMMRARSRIRLPELSGWIWISALAITVLALNIVRVPLSTLAPAEITAAYPVTITAPFDGVVARVEVRPYAMVEVGAPLITFDETDLRANRDISLKSLAVAEAELAQTRNRAFVDREAKTRIEILERQVELQREILEQAEGRLAQHVAHAPIAGAVLFDERYDWRGRPVRTGERLMVVANPLEKEIRIDLPVGALIPVNVGAPVELFLDMDPSHSRSAILSSIGYEARVAEGRGLVYHYTAKLKSNDQSYDDVLLGARGTAKILGADVSLGYFLLRRPWAVLRRYMGL